MTLRATANTKLQKTSKQTSLHKASSAAKTNQPPVAAGRDAEKMRILVVEDNGFLRKGLISLINRQADLVCCGEADTAAGTPALVVEAEPHVVVLDLRLKDVEAFELIASLTREFPVVPILILSQSGEAAVAERALRAGARGYVVKQDASEEILAAIWAVLQGKLYVSRDLAGRLVHKLLQNSVVAGLDCRDQGADLIAR